MLSYGGGRAARFACGGSVGGGGGAGEEARKGVVGGAYVRRGIYCSVYHTTQEGKQVKVQKVTDLFFLSRSPFVFLSFLFFFSKCLHCCCRISLAVFTHCRAHEYPCISTVNTKYSQNTHVRYCVSGLRTHTGFGLVWNAPLRAQRRLRTRQDGSVCTLTLTSAD